MFFPIPGEKERPPPGWAGIVPARRRGGGQQEYVSQFIGEQEVFLLEEEERGSKRMLGHTARYQRVSVEVGAYNQLVQVRIIGLEGEILQAKLL